MLIEYAGMTVKELYDFVISIAPGEETLKPGNILKLCHSISYYSVVELDRRNSDCGIGPYSSTEELLMNYFENEENMAHS